MKYNTKANIGVIAVIIIMILLVLAFNKNILGIYIFLGILLTILVDYGLFQLWYYLKNR